MTASIHTIADRQSPDVQRRAIVAVSLQRQRLNTGKRPRLAEIMGDDLALRSPPIPASLDAWYRQQPVKRGRISPSLTLSDWEKQVFGLPRTARLVDLRNLGDERDHWTVAVFPVLGGFVVGVKAPAGGGGVGVLWKRSYKASDYALRLSVEHGMPIRERYA
ncbi:hypothetical protein [Sphingomonas sp. 8AM]|uniref:hypothetical protein n=1 Tax=Sphingomonas sp. 8AM TaxID=2653170 RepID=UPI0012F2CD87|nr:hypothetical protein [Sphingomonas sp. 8AM]VXC48863.1 conserved hypothetical protein [Sphingomonas sp. 8AM]